MKFGRIEESTGGKVTTNCNCKVNGRNGTNRAVEMCSDGAELVSRAIARCGHGKDRSDGLRVIYVGGRLSRTSELVR